MPERVCGDVLEKNSVFELPVNVPLLRKFPLIEIRDVLASTVAPDSIIKSPVVDALPLNVLAPALMDRSVPSCDASVEPRPSDWGEAPEKYIVLVVAKNAPAFVRLPVILSICCACRIALAPMLRFVVDAALEKVVVAELLMTTRLANAEVPVIVPDTVCGEALENVVVPEFAVKIPLLA